jgi:hypothetical protein
VFPEKKKRKKERKCQGKAVDLSELQIIFFGPIGVRLIDGSCLKSVRSFFLSPHFQNDIPPHAIHQLKFHRKKKRNRVSEKSTSGSICGYFWHFFFDRHRTFAGQNEPTRCRSLQSYFLQQPSTFDHWQGNYKREKKKKETESAKSQRVVRFAGTFGIFSLTDAERLRAKMNRPDVVRCSPIFSNNPRHSITGKEIIKGKKKNTTNQQKPPFALKTERNTFDIKRTVFAEGRVRQLIARNFLPLLSHFLAALEGHEISRFFRFFRKFGEIGFVHPFLDSHQFLKEKIQ